MQEELVEAAKLSVVSALARTSGHDIKHNIATALLYVDALTVKCDREKDRRLFNIYTNIKDALQMALDELQDLLMAYKSKPRHMARWEVGDIFRRVEQQLSREAEESGIRLSVVRPEDGRAVHADIDQMVRVFSNLFTNSRDAIKERRGADAGSGEGLISLSSSIDGGSVHLIWEDNGCGIPEEDRQRIFNAFFTKKQSDIGSGLGLYIVKTILEAHGGRISADPTDGAGARFRMTLPLSAAGRVVDGGHLN
jgi:signal transduction histidine kinase